MRLLANEAAALQAKLLRCEPRPKRPAIRRAHVRRRHLASAGGESPPAYHRARRRLHPLQFIEYIVRGPLSNERLEIQTNGDVKLALIFCHPVQSQPKPPPKPGSGGWDRWQSWRWNSPVWDRRRAGACYPCPKIER